MSAIVMNPDNNSIVGWGLRASRVDAQNEIGLIKVQVNEPTDSDPGFYYIGTTDRDSYSIIETDYPEDILTVTYKYVDGAFVQQ